MSFQLFTLAPCPTRLRRCQEQPTTQAPWSAHVPWIW